MTELWYSPRDGLPPIGVQVLVQWCGREFEAARVHRKGGSHAWLTATAWMRDEHGRWVPRRSPQPVLLPDDGLPGVDYGPDPDVWRPIKPEAWKAPLPRPVDSITPRMWSSRTRFQAVEEAEAADLAREMEADREAARAAGESVGRRDPRRAREGLAWWRDATRVTYSAPGSISVAEAEARISRALLTDGIRFRREAVQEQRVSSALAIIAASTLSSEHDDPLDWVDFDPLPRDQGDYLIAMGWFAAMAPPRRYSWEDYSDAQRLLVWRAQGRGWRDISIDLGGSDTQARRDFGGALFQVWCIANGWEIGGRINTADQLAALRDRSRQARARGTA